MNRHIETVHEGKLFECSICDFVNRFSRKDKLNKHIDERHKNPITDEELSDFGENGKNFTLIVNKEFLNLVK